MASKDSTVKDVCEDDGKSEISAHSKRSRTSSKARSRRSSVKSDTELSERKAVLKAKKQLEERKLKALQEENELETAYEERRAAIKLEQEKLAFEKQKKVIDLKKACIANDEELLTLEEMTEASDDECSERDEEISFKGIGEDMKGDVVQRFFDSQEKIQTPPHQPELQSTSSPVASSPGASSQGVPAGWEKIASSLEGCITQLSRVAMGQTTTSNNMTVTNPLPKIDVPVFDGDPLHFMLWKNAFDSMVDAKPISDKDKLNFLNAYVSGKAKDIVEHYLLLGGDDGYREARWQLERRFGDPNTISVSYTKKLFSWPKIGSRDATGLQDFSDFLQKVVAAKRSVRNLGILDFPQENVKIVEKLPGYLEGKWRDEVDRCRTRMGQQSYPTFSVFADFVERAAARANIPELEPLSTKELKPSFPANRARGTKARSFATTGRHSEDRKPEAQHRAKHGPYLSCPFCDGDHAIDQCENFMKKPMSIKKTFFRSKMLCWGCGYTDHHRVKDCREKKKCRTCGKSHLTCFHFDITSPSEGRSNEGTSNCTSVCTIPDQDDKDHCMIVPVWVRHHDNTSKETLEYAILDDQSNVSFISKRLCERLDVKGDKTNLLLTTMHKTANIESEKVRGIEVLDFWRKNVVQLPTSFSRDSVPASRSQIPKPDVVRQWPHLSSIADEMMPYRDDVEVSLLIGNDCTRAIRPREVITGGEDDPYAQRSLLGWGVIGRVCKTRGEVKSAACNKTSVDTYSNFAFPTKTKEILCPEKILQVLETDFKEENESRAPLSVQDRRFLDILEKGITRRQDGHYEMPLPFKADQVTLPDNRQLAIKRWNQLNARFKKNPKFLEDYKGFMKDVISTCAERAPDDYTPGRINYVPHTGVYHPKKPGKIRVVFDCSAKYQGVSLNENLLQGPDLTNGLLGVLSRFRQEEVAIMADIQSMFHQFYVAEKDRDMLRFLWWEDGDTTKHVVEYRMMVHLFGAASSPSCANFGLKRAADDGEEEFGEAAANYIRNEFYVDDGLKSVATVDEAVNLMKAAQNICSQGGLRLHKILSNKKEVLESFPVKDRAKGVADLNLDADPLPLERALGVVWCVESDTLQFRLVLHDRPLTRRGILSTVCSIYDPNGYVSPVTLKGKQILQQLCRIKLDWDSPIPEDIRVQWEKWRQEIGELEKFKVSRCFKPTDFGTVKHVELHHFSDASQEGYGQCSYIRLINESDNVSCSLVLAKSRVTPLKAVTIPRLELQAATISAKMSEFLRRELSYAEIREFFWTDSKIVLGYINNEARRFHVYVANRVQQIRDRTDPSKWFYIDTSSNPADDASRGLTASELLQSHRWLVGPSFLQGNGQFQPSTIQSEQPSIQDSDPEVKRASTHSTRAQYQSCFESSRLHHISTWHRARKSIALCLKFKRILQNRVVKKGNQPTSTRPLPKVSLSVAELQEAEMEIIRCLQIEAFSSERAILQHLKVGKDTNRTTAKTRNHEIKTSSSLYRLDPFIDGEGIIRVGGRINRANVSHELKHPAIMPRKGHLTELMIRHYHERTHHMGRGITHNHLRQSGYWVIGGSSAVSNIISKCVVCKKMRGSLLQQKMAELPEDRLTPAAPFTYCAVDYFGPFNVKERRSEVKRYGVVFTCMASRGIHLESVNSLTASSFINCLRRFLSRRGPVRQIRSDHGTAFVGARNELRQALLEMDGERVQEYLRGNDVDWIPFQMNAPHSSHMGGVWERQIGTVRRALEHLLGNSGHQLDDESFRTFLTEVECIVNSRPLTTTNLCSSDAPEPLTPNHLLTMKPKIVLPPPGKFQEADSYSRKWWRRVQHLTNEFWLRWRKEFLTELQTRQKWVRPKRSVRVGDIVIVQDNGEARGNWPMGRVEKVFPSKDGLVRKVQLVMADKSLGADGRRRHQPTTLERPIHKLVILIPAEETSQLQVSHQEDQGIPHQGALKQD